MTAETSEARARILKTAGMLFSKFGFRSISMDDISQHNGISKKTLYQYFSDKDEIVTLAIQGHLSTEKEMLRQIQAEARDTVDFLISANNYLMRNFRETSPATVHELKKYHQQAWDVIDNFRKEFLLNVMAENLRNGIAEGNIRPGIDMDILSRLRLEALSLVIDPDVTQKDSFKATEVSWVLLEHFIAGIATDNGRKLYRKYVKEYNRETKI